MSLRRSTTWTTETVKPGPGRPKGSHDKIPRSVKASIRAVFEEVATEDPELIRRAVRAGLEAPPPKSFPYLQLAAFYVDGRPVEDIKLQIEPPKPVVMRQEFPDGRVEELVTVPGLGAKGFIARRLFKKGSDGQLVLVENDDRLLEAGSAAAADDAAG
jgi:hypothetical protein